jgi:hypothetical protein
VVGEIQEETMIWSELIGGKTDTMFSGVSIGELVWSALSIASLVALLLCLAG